MTEFEKKIDEILVGVFMAGLLYAKDQITEGESWDVKEKQLKAILQLFNDEVIGENEEVKADTELGAWQIVQRNVFRDQLREKLGGKEKA